MAKDRKASTKKKGISSVRVDLSDESMDTLMDCAEREKRSVRAQAAYLVEQGLEEWKARQQGGKREPAR